jgi:hypothetical protein
MTHGTLIHNLPVVVHSLKIVGKKLIRNAFSNGRRSVPVRTVPGWSVPVHFQKDKK